MEINLNGMWRLKPDPSHIGSEMKWYLPDVFPLENEDYWAPQYFDSKVFAVSGTVWIRKDITVRKLNPGSTYNLVFYGGDKANVWVNGKSAGRLERTARRQILDITAMIKEETTIIMEFLDVTKDTIGLSKPAYILENTEVPSLSGKKIQHTPSWVMDAQIYSVYVRNFSEEGTFEQVYQKLDYIQNLGTNVLWFMPIHPIGQTGRKGKLGSPYAIYDYYEINPEYGNHDDLRKVVNKAHALGMKVILDLVINHTAKDSRMDEINPGFHKPQHRQTADLWGWTDVKDLDYENKETREYILAMMEWWVREYEIDGYRCDVAFLVPDDFWQDAISHLRKIKPGLVMLAESDVPTQYLAGFDLTYDWQYMGLLHRIGRGYFPLSEIKEYIEANVTNFPQGAVRMICLENHDTDRAAHTFTTPQLECFQVIKFMTPGVPLIYNGEELSISHRPDLFNKDGIDWSNTAHPPLAFYQFLGRLRQANPSLRAQDNLQIDYKDNRLLMKRSGSAHAFVLSVEADTFRYTLEQDGEVILSNGSMKA